MASNEEAIEVDSDATEPLPSSEDGDEEELWMSSQDEEPEEEPLPEERDWPPVAAVAVPPLAVPPVAAVPPPARAPPVTITTVTDAQGNVLQPTRGRPRTTPTRFLAVTSDPFKYSTGEGGNHQLRFVIRGLPATKKHPGLGRQGNRYNTTSGLEKEFRDVAYKLFQNKLKGVLPDFGRAPLYIHVKAFFPMNQVNKLHTCNGVGDCNNLLNFVQDSLQQHVYQDDAQILDAHATKVICEQYGNEGYTTVCITKGKIDDFCFYI